MSMQSFSDYYFILQVHQNAEPEIVKSAYRRLAQMYHPDRNPDPQAEQRMQSINQAYNVISDPELRRAYHAQWLRHHQQAQQQPPKAAPRPEAAAYEVLDSYFRSLLQEDWAAAYDKLSAVDRALIPLRDFGEWKNAVKALYQMGSYAIKAFRAYDKCIVGSREYEKAHVFSVFLTDRDRRTGAIGEDTYTKYVVLEQGRWRVCLGYTELKTIIHKLKYIAAQAPELDAARVYTDALLKQDKLTGLLSRKGLLECMEREIARSRRFKSRFSLAVLTVEPQGSLQGLTAADYGLMCVARAAASLKDAMRAIDYAARLSDNQLAVLLIETGVTSALRALQRLARAAGQCDGVKYAIKGSVTAYMGETAEDTLIRAAHEARTQVVAGADKVKKYRFDLDEKQV